MQEPDTYKRTVNPPVVIEIEICAMSCPTLFSEMIKDRFSACPSENDSESITEELIQKITTEMSKHNTIMFSCWFISVSEWM